MSTNVFTVTGMTCSHCAMSVTEEIKLIAGVDDVDVHLATGQVTVSATEPVDRSQIEAAVAEAGYELAAG